MSDWSPKRYDPPGEGRDEDGPDGCPKCGWREWETIVWLYTGVFALILGGLILTGGGQ